MPSCFRYYYSSLCCGTIPRCAVVLFCVML
uniref:Pheromone-like protein n=1 Tax=Schizophyllum commune (strain H4-8 / FGSC 9210) TaxID=578458 RepID=D8QF41_SCHCM